MVIPQRATRLQSGPGALCAVNHTPSAHVSVADRSVAAWAGLCNLTQPSHLALGLASPSASLTRGYNSGVGCCLP